MPEQCDNFAYCESMWAAFQDVDEATSDLVATAMPDTADGISEPNGVDKALAPIATEAAEAISPAGKLTKAILGMLFVQLPPNARCGRDCPTTKLEAKLTGKSVE